MGCCQSFPDEDVPHLPIPNADHVTSSSNLSMADSMELEDILAQIPVHCRQPIINLPAREFLKVYQHHLVGKYYFERKKFLLSIAHETRAMSQLADMMPNHKDHFIYVDICNVMSSCFLELDGARGAAMMSQWALGFTLKHTPTNYTAVSFQYSRLAVAYHATEEWREAGYCLTKAIETARLTNDPDQEYILKLVADLDSLKNRIIDNAQWTIIVREVIPNPDESMEDFRRRAIAEMIEYNAQNGTLQFDKAEFERLPNKQTEAEVDNEILKDVLQNLENHLHVSAMETGEVSFIAAQFKNIRMKTSLLSPAIIEAALTMIIDQIKDEDLTDNEQYGALKQSSFSLSYTHEDSFYKKGVRVFQTKRKIKQSDEQQHIAAIQ